MANWRLRNKGHNLRTCGLPQLSMLSHSHPILHFCNLRSVRELQGMRNGIGPRFRTIQPVVSFEGPKPFPAFPHFLIPVSSFRIPSFPHFPLVSFPHFPPIRWYCRAWSTWCWARCSTKAWPRLGAWNPENCAIGATGYLFIWVVLVVYACCWLSLIYMYVCVYIYIYMSIEQVPVQPAKPGGGSF